MWRFVPLTIIEIAGGRSGELQLDRPAVVSRNAVYRPQPSSTMVLMGDFVHHDGAEGRRRFEELLAKRFPSIAAQIDEIERGLLHLEMGAFARPTCNAIDSGDSEEVATHLAFIDQFFVDAPPDLENAIYVSYLKDVFLGRDDERYLSARSRPSSRLAAALVDLEKHWRKIAEWNRKRPGP